MTKYLPICFLTCLIICPIDAIFAQVASATATAEVQLATQDEDRISADEFAQFIRIRKDGRKPVSLETSITRYEGTNAKGEPITVDLIGVVHVGEQEYYETLNERFTGYDALLYELVAPEGTRIPKGGRDPEAEDGFNPIAGLQMGMKSMLGLEFQLEHIDYTAENFVHADMSPEEFFESMSANDESVGRIVTNSIGASLARQAEANDMQAGMILSLFSKDKTKRLRQSMADQMIDMEGGLTIFEGKDGSTIIDHRNRKVIDILQREIDDGQHKLAIFFGAGHLPDMQRRLMNELNLKRGGRLWLEAWNLEGQQAAARAREEAGK